MTSLPETSTFTVAGLPNSRVTRSCFDDGTTFKADVIMCCTGYQDRFDFLEDFDIPDVRNLYKHVFHP